MTNAYACGCTVCWCMAPVPGLQVCERCQTGEHTASDSVAAANPSPPPIRKCPHPKGAQVRTGDVLACGRCGHVFDQSKIRMGRNSGARGRRHELHAARLYGGTKVGPLGGPADVVGKMFAVQVKTHQGPPPARLLALLAAMDVGAGGRVPVVLDRYLRPGQTPIDLFTVRGHDWLTLHGTDGVE